MDERKAGISSRLITRRRALYLAGAGTVAASLVACGSSTDDASDPAAGSQANPDCVLTPEKIEGPFYTDLDLVRSDITDGKPGAPLELELSVIDADTCEPIPDAAVDIWHADATGLYSAFTGQGDDADIDTTAESFLRGVQATDATGTATFSTIYPGWYRGRTTHIHVKVHFSDQTRVTSQLYFPDDVSDAVYATDAAYSERGAKDTSNDDDDFGADLTSLRMAVRSTADGHAATHTIGISKA